MKLKLRPLSILLTVAVCFIAATSLPASAATTSTDDQGFAVQVSPSPLIATLEPGQTTTEDLQIRNTGTSAQQMKMGLRSFSINEDSGKISLGNTPTDISKFVSFSDPTFSVEAGQIFTQHISIATPASAGFTYSFVITVGQQNPPKASGGKTAIQGSVAVFTLLSVDKAGATRQMQIQTFGVTKHVYEYLPATVTLKLKNTGNTLIQPQGTIYIQRHDNDAKPITAIQLNKDGGYILPGSSRVLTTTWTQGFPHYATVTTSSGTTKQKLTWQGGDISKLRFGRYVAKVVAVYNDGTRDVPVTAEVSFWVIPWRMLFFILIIIVLIVVGAVTVLRKSSKVLHHKPPKTHAKSKE